MRRSGDGAPLHGKVGRFVSAAGNEVSAADKVLFRTAQACNARLSLICRPSLPGAPDPSQPRALTQETTFENLAEL